MKKIITIIMFVFCFLSINAQIYQYTPKYNWAFGEEYGEIFNYTISCDSSTNYLIKFYHFLRSIGDESYNRGEYPSNGKLLLEGKLIIKLKNDSIFTFNYFNNKSKYYDINDDYRYFILSVFINKNDLAYIINIGVNKFRIETDKAYIDINPIFNYDYFKDGYFDIMKQTSTKKKNIYENL